jgi:hypothetical protein
MLWGGAIFVLLIALASTYAKSRARALDLAHRGAGDASCDGRDLRPAGAAALTESTGALGSRRRRRPRALGWWALRAAPFFGFDRLPSGLGLALDAPGRSAHVLLIALVGIGRRMIPGESRCAAPTWRQVIREEGRSGTRGAGRG